ncbi:MAG TPA: VOC family protein [Solirubrobacterales bacterium]|jgi:predicted enzyme related to lactoylglutathione lyase|nr:VOC family protein [Solirubrobacterales bacterium]
MPAPNVTGVDFVTVFVKDYPAALKFYGEVLGLEHSVDYEKIPAGEFETGSLTLQVMDAASVGQEFKPSGHPIALHVDDVAAARAGLESQGVEFMGATIDSGVCHMAIFRDPDGNALMFHNRYAPRAS